MFFSLFSQMQMVTRFPRGNDTSGAIHLAKKPYMCARSFGYISMILPRNFYFVTLDAVAFGGEFFQLLASWLVTKSGIWWQKLYLV
jgi:hypothetical protein